MSAAELAIAIATSCALYICGTYCVPIACWIARTLLNATTLGLTPNARKAWLAEKLPTVLAPLKSTDRDGRVALSVLVEAVSVVVTALGDRTHYERRASLGDLADEASSSQRKDDRARDAKQWAIVATIRRTISRSTSDHDAGTGVSSFESRPGRVLWVDDHPDNNLMECRMLARLGLAITAVVSTEDCLAELDHAKTRRQPYVLILSDMERGGDPRAGEVLLRRLELAGHDQEVIFYVTHLDESKPTPCGSFGITNRPDALVNLALVASQARDSRS